MHNGKQNHMKVALEGQLHQVCFLQEVRTVKPSFYRPLAVVVINCPSDASTQHSFL